jgi:hypothetical protein
MNFDPPQASSLLGPLFSKSSIFLISDRETNLSFARVLLGQILSPNMNCLIVDIDAFYASHAEELDHCAGWSNTTIYVPDVVCDTREVVHTMIAKGHNNILIIDNVNSLFHMLSHETPQVASRKLALIMAVLSKHARASHLAAVSIMYERRFASPTTNRQPLSELGDALVSVRRRGTGLVFNVRRGEVWAGGTYEV